MVYLLNMVIFHGYVKYPKYKVLGCWISHAFFGFFGGLLGNLTDLLESHTIPLLKCSETPTKTLVSAAFRYVPSPVMPCRGAKKFTVKSKKLRSLSALPR